MKVLINPNTKPESPHVVIVVKEVVQAARHQIDHPMQNKICKGKPPQVMPLRGKDETQTERQHESVNSRMDCQGLQRATLA
jgi:hypothetical protein